jgi:hypothetical protein
MIPRPIRITSASSTPPRWRTIARDVSSLTGGKQNPDMEVRFDTTVFAVGL